MECKRCGAPKGQKNVCSYCGTIFVSYEIDDIMCGELMDFGYVPDMLAFFVSILFTLTLFVIIF